MDPRHRDAESSTPPPVVHRPRSIDDVVELVRAARARGERLYPISTGLNWGYGSATPPVPGCSLVDLGAMRSIRNADAIGATNPVAVIEPGVTQAQLYDWLQLHCPALTFNVTGSARETSIIGNALDRGVGYFGPRRDDLFGLEVVTGTGEVLHTGFRRLGADSPLAATHPFGLGPMLDGLFFQGNFGIVTSACFRLLPRQPSEVVLSFALRDPQLLAAFIDALAEAKRSALLTSVAHIGNGARTRSTLLCGATQYLTQRCGLADDAARRQAGRALALVAPAEWAGLAAVTGPRGIVRETVAELRRRLRRLAQVRVVTERRLTAAFAAADRMRRFERARTAAAVLAAIRPLHGLALGQPTDAPVEGLLWQFGSSHLDATRLDESPCGLLYVCPALPMDGAFVVRALAGLEAIAAQAGFEFYVTVNIETPTSLVAIVNLLFDRRDPAQVDRAMRCADALHRRIHALGLEVYRARTDAMATITSLQPGHWAQVARLRRALDPDGIISPGRYCPPD